MVLAIIWLEPREQMPETALLSVEPGGLWTEHILLLVPNRINKDAIPFGYLYLLFNDRIGIINIVISLNVAWLIKTQSLILGSQPKD